MRSGWIVVSLIPLHYLNSIRRVIRCGGSNCRFMVIFDHLLVFLCMWTPVSSVSTKLFTMKFRPTWTNRENKSWLHSPKRPQSLNLYFASWRGFLQRHLRSLNRCGLHDVNCVTEACVCGHDDVSAMSQRISSLRVAKSQTNDRLSESQRAWHYNSNKCIKVLFRIETSTDSIEQTAFVSK